MNFNICLLAACITFLPAISNTSQAQNVWTPSGLLLGIYCHSCRAGLHVDSIMPGTAAEGKLLKYDHILEIGDYRNGRHHPARTLMQIERAKEQIGPNVDAPMLVRRANRDEMFDVRFVPITVPAGNGEFRTQYRTVIRTGGNKAKSFFQKQHEQRYRPPSSSRAERFFRR